MNKIELLAPCGDIEKLKIAVMYGADAVYFGGKSFSLRARASNFDLDDIKEGVEFAHKYNAKVYVTMNIVPHDEDLSGLEEYLLKLNEYHVDGIIVSSMYIASVAHRLVPDIELHLSTQASVNNSIAINQYKDFGFARVVLAREASLDEIKIIKDKVDVSLEVFIHGGMCSAYSGRCMLSNHLTNRDANRGGCAHSCRWNYDLYTDKHHKLNNGNYFNIGSKDLSGLSKIFDLIDLGVTSLKIEGRMKSLYYIATVVRCYRNLIDAYYEAGCDRTKVDLTYYINEIEKAENRLTSVGFLDGNVTINEQLYSNLEGVPTKEFVGIVNGYSDDYVIVEQRNYFKVGDTLEVFGPNTKNKKFVVTEIINSDGDKVEVANHPLELLKIKIPFEVSSFDMLRKE